MFSSLKLKDCNASQFIIGITLSTICKIPHSNCFNRVITVDCKFLNESELGKMIRFDDIEHKLQSNSAKLDCTSKQIFPSLAKVIVV